MPRIPAQKAILTIILLIIFTIFLALKSSLSRGTLIPTWATPRCICTINLIIATICNQIVWLVQVFWLKAYLLAIK